MFKWKEKILLMLLFLPLPSFANCGSSIQISPINLTWSQTFNYASVNVTINKVAAVACTVYLTFGKGFAADYNRYSTSGGNKFYYQLFQDTSLSNILKDQADTTVPSNNYLSYSFSANPNQSVVLTYYIQLPFGLATSPTYKPYGTYTDSISVKLFEDALSSIATPVSTTPLNVTITVPQIIEMAFGSANSGFNPTSLNQSLDFGDLTSGKTLATSFLVRSNSGYSISMSSTNGGQLNNTLNSADKIPYSVSVNGSTLTLSSSPTIIATSSGQTSDSGSAFPFSIITNSQSVQPTSGTYTDSISITAISTQ